MTQVNPAILAWARKTAGLSLEEAARRVGIGAVRGVPGPERLQAIEQGDVEPSRAQLVKMAQQYRRPLLTFYLQEPPEPGDRGQDFRTLPEALSVEDDAYLDALLRDIRVRQRIVKTTLEAEDEASVLAFVGSKRTADGIPSVKRDITRVLGFSLESFRSQRTADDSFAYLRRLVEDAGIFVLLAGNLGSHHTSIDVDVFRGFALADPIAPFVVINDQDASTAWSFTLLHEVVHIWLGETGISGAYAGIALEKFCSDVASELLLPNAELSSLSDDALRVPARATAAISEFARDRRISHSLVAYRLFRDERLSEAQWRALNRSFRTLWMQGRNDARARSREREGGPNYYVVRRHRIGRGLLRFTERMVREGALTHTRAAKVLGVKPTNVETLLRGSTNTVSE